MWRQAGGVTQDSEVVRAGDTEAISVGEDAAPEPRVHGADFGQEEEAPTQVVMGRLLNRDSASASEPLHRGWEVRAAEGAVQDDPVGGPERPLGTGGHCTRIKKVGRVGQPHCKHFPNTTGQLGWELLEIGTATYISLSSPLGAPPSHSVPGTWKCLKWMPRVSSLQVYLAWSSLSPGLPCARIPTKPTS